MAKRKPKEKDFQQVADEYAQSALESIRDMVEALEHAESCEEEGCKVGSETRRVKVTVPCPSCNGSGGMGHCNKCGASGKVKQWTRQDIHEEPEAWHDREIAERRIHEDALSVEVRSDWYTPGWHHPDSPSEYNILLGTGGPASRIIGDLNKHCQPTSAHFEYQDWFKPWTRARLSGADEDVLLKYAQAHYFGE